MGPFGGNPDKRVKTAGDIVPNLFWLPLVGFLVTIGYGVSESVAITLVSLGVAAAAFLFGSLGGFLFGIPRALTGDTATVTTQSGVGQAPLRRTYQPNTNLEQVSDWLTKIIIGVGLVELGKLRESIRQLVEFLKPGLGNDATASVAGLSVLVYFSISGFLCAYLVTRLVLQKELNDLDGDVEVAATRI